MSASREARKKAMGRILKLAGDALGARLEAKRPKPAPAPEPVVEAEPEIADDDARRLIELYEGKQGEAPEA